MGNLALTRRKNEEVFLFLGPEKRQCLSDIFKKVKREDIVPMINSLIKIKVVEITGSQVRLSFEAPKEFTILRSEIYIPIKETKPTTRRRNPLQKLWDKVKKCA